MSGLAEAGLALVMLVGLLGVLVPLLPGTALVLGAGLVWVLADGGGTGRWVVLGAMAVLFAVGIVLKYALPGHRLVGGLPRTTLLAGAAGAVAGFVVLPPLGLPVGGVGAVWLAERSRLGDARLAWSSTGAVLKAIGLGLLAEMTAGVAMVAVWVVGVLAT